MVYYCKIIDDDKSYTIHGPYTLEEIKYAISLKNISVDDWFAKRNKEDVGNKPLKINTWLPANSFDEFHNSFYPPWSMVDILFSTTNSKNVPTYVRLQFALCLLGLLMFGGFLYYYWQKTHLKFSLKSSVSKAEEDAILAPVRANADAWNRKDIKNSLAYIHPFIAEKTEEMTKKIFETYDLHTRLTMLAVESVSFDEARVRFSQTTEKTKGPAFRDNIVEGVHTLKKHNGSWKIYKTDVTNVEFIN
ncbi:MAG: hypothetical protein NTV50_14500 [Planctomycetota bacterium]|nr:hypothetical protein [Planctomycetota bacterium]